jgi:hypothetical protein
VRVRVVGVGVHAVRERDVGTVGRRADQDLPRARVEVGAGGLRRREAAGRLQHDVHAEFGPRQLRRFALGEHLDTTAVDDEDVPVHGHRAAEAPCRRVEGQQPC